jgi:hypothetical protein
MDADRELPAAPNAVQPNEQATDYLVNLAPDQEGCASIPPAPGDHSGHSAPSGTRALVDGVGVYTASPGSPFLTAPVVATSDSTAELVPGTQLADLTEPLRQQIWRFPLRPRVSEEEVSGLVAAVLNVIARHLPLASDPARR